MKKSSVKYILCTLLVVCLITAEGIALYRHHQKASPQTAAPVTTSGPGSRTDASETPLPETTPDPDSPEGKIYYAFEQILNEPSFQVDTDATINLKGRLIKGKRVLSARAHVTGADDRDNLKLDMTTKTTVPITLKRMCITAVRFEFVFVPIVERSAVTQVPIF